MKASNFIKFAGRLRRAYPKVGLFGDPELLEIWWLRLSDLDDQAVAAAIDDWVSKNKRPPTADDIRETAEKYQQGRTSLNEAMEQRRIKAARNREEAADEDTDVRVL